MVSLGLGAKPMGTWSNGVKEYFLGWLRLGPMVQSTWRQESGMETNSTPTPATKYPVRAHKHSVDNVHRPMRSKCMHSNPNHPLSLIYSVIASGMNQWQNARKCSSLLFAILHTMILDLVMSGVVGCWLSFTSLVHGDDHMTGHVQSVSLNSVLVLKSSLFQTSPSFSRWHRPTLALVSMQWSLTHWPIFYTRRTLHKNGWLSRVNENLAVFRDRFFAFEKTVLSNHSCAHANENRPYTEHADMTIPNVRRQHAGWLTLSS